MVDEIALNVDLVMIPSCELDVFSPNYGVSSLAVVAGW